ncbi:hypothetical protein CAPTEDRAFT_109708, partial [Capitella teleta]
MDIVDAEAPRFLSGFESASMLEENKVAFECVVMGDPTPCLTWLCNDQKIDNGYDIKHDEISGQCQIVIPEIPVDQPHKFTCVAENEAGESKITAEL